MLEARFVIANIFAAGLAIPSQLSGHLYLMPIDEGVRFNECMTEMTVVLRILEQVIQD
jgi:hypothetical protein